MRRSAAGQNAFEETHFRLMPAQFQAFFGPESVSQVLDALAHLFQRDLRFPLEGRVGFGHERRDGRRHLQTGHPPPGGVTGLAAQVHDGFNIFLRFSGAGRIMKYSFTCCQPCSNSLRTCSISPSSVTPLLMMSRRRWLPASGASVASGTPDARQTAHDVVVDGAHAQGRQGHGNLFRFAAVHRTEEQGFQRREVTRAEGKEGHVVETGVVQAVFEDFFQIRQAAFAGGTVQDARPDRNGNPGYTRGRFRG